MIPPSPALVLHTYLIAAGYGTDPASSSAWPIFLYHLVDLPHAAICVYDTTGIKDGRETRGSTIIHPGAQIRVRGTPHDYSSSRDKIHALRDILDDVYRETITVGAQDYLLQSVTQPGDILELGPDEPNRRYEFTLNCLLNFAE